jgi:hypothetical protein
MEMLECIVQLGKGKESV